VGRESTQPINTRKKSELFSKKLLDRCRICHSGSHNYSLFWAESKGDINAVLAITTPEMRQDLEDKYFNNKTDQERSAILLETVKNVTGIKVQKKTVLPDGQVAFNYTLRDMLRKSYLVVTMRKIGDEWKVSSVEHHN